MNQDIFSMAGWFQLETWVLTLEVSCSYDFRLVCTARTRWMDGEMTERNREQRTVGQLQKEICSARWTAWGDDEGEEPLLPLMEGWRKSCQD